MSAAAPSPAIPDELPLGRGSVSWRVNAEPAVFLGGGRALLMQVAHPGVGAGVAQHSSYASDPWGRLFRTVDTMMKLSFGTAQESARQQRMLDKMHRRVRGTTDDGEPYSALDPDLQLWVWATLVDTALLVYERVRPPLPPADRERYYQEAKLVAYGCGVPRGACPGTWDDFERYIARVVAEDLRVTDSARAVAVATKALPLPFRLGDLTAAPIQLVTAGLLPPSLREQYGFSWDAAKERRLRRFFAAARATGVVPSPVRQLGARVGVARKRPLRIPWLQQRGADITLRRLEQAGFGS
jgi:uncharacterized protein (DUF2236 family)